MLVLNDLISWRNLPWIGPSSGNYKLTGRSDLPHSPDAMKYVAMVALLFFIAPHTHALDVDGNGMSDVFEQIYSVTDPALDPDGDGKNNLAESLAGTHPRDNSNYFKATYSLGSQPGFWRLTWASVSGKNYDLRMSNDLLPGNWFTIPGPSTAGTGGVLSVESSYAYPAPNLKTFYQAITRPSEDLDADLLDAWEEILLGTSDSLLDDDGDLIPSVLEFVNETNPLSASSPADAAAYLATGADEDAFEVFTAGD
jgi:hypothetical protein